jgi:hypothetical protein
MQVRVEEAGKKVHVSLSKAELEILGGGGTLNFKIPLPDGESSAQILRNDATPVEPAPNFRLRIAAEAFAGVAAGNTVTPLFADIPFTLVLTPTATVAAAAPPTARPSSAPPPSSPTKPNNTPATNAWATIGGGVLMILIGAMRAGLSRRHSDTGVLMLVIGLGMIVFGFVRWLSKR